MGETNLSLKLLRIRNGLNQEGMAQRLGMSRRNYSLIETGKAHGTITFWNKVQREFDLTGAEIWRVINNKESAEV